MNSKSPYKKNIMNANEMLQFASYLANTIDTNVIIYLHGPLGAGKTTWVRGFLSGLGYTDKVKSPTYTVVESYQIENKILFHFDFYRINDPRELEHIGIHDYFTAPAICLIEWPEKGFPFLPDADLICYIAFNEPGRELHLVAKSAKGEKILEAIKE